MNTQIAIIISSIVAVLIIILVMVGFEHVYNYLTITIPLKQAVQEIDYIGEFHYDPVDDPHSDIGTVTNIKIINENQLEIIFTSNSFQVTDGKKIIYKVPDFHYSAMVNKNQTFVESCVEFKEKDTVGLGILQYMGVAEIQDKSFFKFFRTNLSIDASFECKYPEIIEESLKINWELQIPDEETTNKIYLEH